MFGPCPEMRRWDQIYALPTEKREKVEKAFLLLRRWGVYTILTAAAIAVVMALIAGLCAWLLGSGYQGSTNSGALMFLLGLLVSRSILWKSVMRRASRKVDDLVGHDPALIEEIRRRIPCNTSRGVKPQGENYGYGVQNAALLFGRSIDSSLHNLQPCMINHLHAIQICKIHSGRLSGI